MLQKSFCGLMLVCVLLLTGCTKKLNTYTVIEVNNEGYLVSDASNNLYQANTDCEIIKATGQNYLSLKPIAPLSSYGTSYSLSNIELASYRGKLKDAAAYCNFLQQEGYTIDNVSYNSQQLDIKLSTTNDEVRVLYLGGDIVRIFYKNFSENVLFPPYTNEQRR